MRNDRLGLLSRPDDKKLRGVHECSGTFVANRTICETPQHSVMGMP
jgi:hypothetical protein